MAAAVSSVETVAEPLAPTSTASSDLQVDVHPAYAGEGLEYEDSVAIATAILFGFCFYSRLYEA